MNIDFARPFTFVFEDKDWVKKVLVGALYALAMLLCYVGLFALLGYQKRVILQTAEGRDVPLPEFDRFGEDLVEGLKIFVIILGYIAPGILIYFCGGFAGGLLAEANEDVGVILMMASMCLAAPLFIVGNLLIPVGIIRYADTNSIGAAFQFGEVFAFVKENAVNLLLAIVIQIAINALAQFTILLLCVGIFAGMAWGMMAQGQAYGQLLRIARARRGGAVVA